MPEEVCFRVRVQHVDYAGFYVHAATTDRAISEHVYRLSKNSPDRRHPVVAGDLDLTLHATRNIDVQAIFADTGKPAANIRIGASKRSQSPAYASGGTTDEQGEVRLRVPPGRYTLSAYPGRDTTYVTVQQELTVSREPEVQTVQVRVEPGCVLILEVVDGQTGQGIGGIVFYRVDPDNGSRWGVESHVTFGDHPFSRPDGKLRAVVYPGRRKYGVGFSGLPDGYRFQREKGPVELPPGGTVAVRFELERTQN